MRRTRPEAAKPGLDFDAILKSPPGPGGAGRGDGGLTSGLDLLRVSEGPLGMWIKLKSLLWICGAVCLLGLILHGG